MKFRVILTLVALSAVSCSMPAHATDYYVSLAGGDDTNNGLHPDHRTGSDGPWHTLRKASRMTYQPGDRILLDRGSTWSDDDYPDDPDECELVLKGSANIRNGEWITVEPYTRVPGDEDRRPCITRPSKDSTPGLLDWSDVINWAAAHPGTGFDQYLDRTYIRIAIRIEGSGWKIRGLEISNAEMGIANYINPGDGFWLEDIYMHDMCGLIWPKHPDYSADGKCFGVWPLTFGAIDMKASNVTVKDCTIIKNYDPTFLGGDGIHGEFHTALFENLYISHMIGGGAAYISGTDITLRNCTILHGEHGICTLAPGGAHALSPEFQGCWFGPDSFDICASTNYVIDNCEIAYVKAEMTPGHAADQAPISIQGENVNVKVRNSFLHDCMHSTFGLHYGIGIFKQIGTRIENNVIYRNGLANLNAGPILSGDAMWPLWHEAASTSDVTYANNRIYRNAAAEQELLCYVDGDPDHYWNSFSDPTCPYDAPDGQYRFAGLGNTIVTGAYDNYVPTPPAISGDLVPSAALSQSSQYSSEYDAANLCDADHGSYWRPSEDDWSDGDVWVRCSWPAAKKVDRIRIFDRPDVGHCSRSGYLRFSNGDRVNVTGGILDNGAMREVILDAPKNVTWVELHVTRREGDAGISELRVYENSVTYPTSEPPDPGPFTCDFTTAPLGALTGTGGGPDAPRNNIDWSNADWAVREESPGGNRCAFINFQPIVNLYPPPALTPLAAGTRTFTLPKGKKLKSIDVYAPPSDRFSSFSIGIGQLGANAHIGISSSDGKWHTFTMSWPAGPPQSDIVTIGFWMPGHPDGQGVHTVAFDNIVYDDK